MAEAAKRATVLTKLVIGKVEVGVGLFTTKDKPSKLAEFDSAGPNGGVLAFEDKARAKALSSEEPMEEIVAPGASDPLASDPGPELPAVSQDVGPENAAALVPGEFTRVLVEQGSGEIVEREDVRKGVRLEDGSFIDCTANLKQIEQQTKLEQMEVVAFIDVAQIDRTRVEASYFIGAQEAEDAKPLRLIYEAMKLKRRVAVVKWSSKSRQSLGVLAAHGRSKTLMLLKLTWAEDVREAPAKALSIQAAGVSREEIDMAARLIEAMGDTPQALDELRDDAIVLREELRAEAEAGNVAAPEPAPDREQPEAVDQFEASLAELMASPREGVRAGKA
jgi:Ku protein